MVQPSKNEKEKRKMTNKPEQEYKCKYCGKKIHKIDYEINHGYCGKCRDIAEWKQILDNIKDYEK
jgi:hypothetical protein